MGVRGPSLLSESAVPSFLPVPCTAETCVCLVLARAASRCWVRSKAFVLLPDVSCEKEAGLPKLVLPSVVRLEVQADSVVQ